MNSLEQHKKQLTHSGHFEFFGLKMSQIPEALIKISTLLQISQPTKIIEFGTGYGGFSHLLNIYCNKNKIDFISYDAQYLIQDFNQHLKLNFRNKNLLDLKVIEEIKLEILQNTKGRTVLFCDALKSEEAKLYAPVLKHGDIVLIHDYSRNQNGNEFKNTCFKYQWSAPQEQWLEKFNEELKINDIEPLFHEELEDVLWFCGIKNKNK